MKRLLALLLCLSLLLSVFALAEEEEEDIDFSELMEQEDVDVDDQGNIVDPDNDDFSEEALRELAENVITGESVDPSELYLNENLPDDVINILLLGLDVKGTKDKKLLKDQGQYAKRADVQIILSINTTDGSIKLTSIARNTLVDIPDRRNETAIANSYGHALYNKSKQYVGWEDTPYMCMATINRNFELNIQDYVATNFYGVASIIEYLGGVDIDLTSEEASAINAYLRKHKKAISSTYDDKKGNREALEKKSGVQHLDGIQALMYGRLRSIDDDFHRTGRTRKLLSSLLTPTIQKIKNKELDLLNFLGESLQYFITNPELNIERIVKIITGVLRSDIVKNMDMSDSLIEEFRIPADGTYYYDKDSSGASVNKFKKGQKQANTEMLHEFIYGAYYPAD